MNPPLRIRHVQIYPLLIPMRLRFEHAAAERDTADPVVVQVAGGSPYAHQAGFGETLARPYVTGETAASVVDDLSRLLVPRLAEFKPTSFAEALEFIESLPCEDEGRVINAARAALELALLDLAGKVFKRRVSDVAGWLGLGGFGTPGSLPRAAYSGMVVGRSAGKQRLMLRIQRLYGLRDFKIKVATEGWEQRLVSAYKALRGPLERHLVTLRADANGGWTLSEAVEAVEVLERCAVSALEQPLPDTLDADLPYLSEQTRCDLIADESLLTVGDAERLIRSRAVKVFNIRLAKNGGLMPALRIARLALVNDLDVQLGCLVGETSILSAAGVGFLETCPKVRFVEGAFGSFLLRRDVVRKPIRFGRGGRVGKRTGFGLGVDVDEPALRALAAERIRSSTI